MKTKYTALLMVTVSDYSLKVYIYIYTTLGRQLVYSSLDYCFNFDMVHNNGPTQEMHNYA